MQSILKDKMSIGTLVILSLISFFSVRAITPDFLTWSTTASDTGIYLSFIPNFWVAHPGGATVYTFIGFVWSNLFLTLGISEYHSLLLLNNLLASLTAGISFLWARHKGLNIFYAAVAGFLVILSAIGFTQFAVIESYPTHGIILLLFFITWVERNNITGGLRWRNWNILFGGLAIGSHHTLLLLVGLTYLLGLFLKDRKDYKALALSGLIGLGIYSTIVFRAILNLTFDAQIEGTIASINNYFRGMTPILQLHIYDIPKRFFAYFPPLLWAFGFPLVFIGLYSIWQKNKGKEWKLFSLLAIIYTFYVLFYISMQGYRYFHLLPIILLPLTISAFLYFQNTPKLKFALLSCIPLLGTILGAQIIHLYPNNDMEKMRTYLYQLRAEAYKSGEQKIILTQYYNEVIGTYWHLVFNEGFLDGGTSKTDKERIALMYSDKAPILVIPTIYLIQTNQISERYKELIVKNKVVEEFSIESCYPEDRKFIPFETYSCVVDKSIEAVGYPENPKIYYATVNPYDKNCLERCYITKQDTSSFIDFKEENYYSRWVDINWPNGIEGRPYWAAFIRGDMEHPYWDSDNYNPYFAVLFIGFWGFNLSVLGMWIYKSARKKKFIKLEEVWSN